MTDYDVVVVGAGVAGLTAARQAAKGGARVLVLDRQGVGGQVATVEDLTNAPGRSAPIAGYDLGVELLEEAEEAGAEILLADIGRIEKSGNGFVVTGADDPVGATAVIIAAGSTRRALGVPGENEFEGRGVSRCASCDGPFFRGKRVIVVGGGDSALDEARVLAGFASEVVVVHVGEAPTSRVEIAHLTLARKNVRFHQNSTVSAIRGEDVVSAVAVHNLLTGDEKELPAHGVFIYIGLSPNTSWISGLVECDESGHIVVDEKLATSWEGVFAAGDIRSGSLALLTESAADGERAGDSALEYLTRARATNGFGTP
ncbi:MULTISPECIES: FAD-dependent oxidoreductase [unclassified Microbacterium]|uniref:NAD(P)/FAD-dependent oxidoreductase n=1 Tax=unclassified Microbacterium TaxID=2609290 RepID=UPI00254F3F73|nr:MULTISPECIES: FAD-dependent oxidoreductase [unclassified Microbacterium]WIM19507.1 FAD-dependent oxidoreductase [Microbacterium sp. zg-B185]